MIKMGFSLLGVLAPWMNCEYLSDLRMQDAWFFQLRQRRYLNECGADTIHRGRIKALPAFLKLENSLPRIRYNRRYLHHFISQEDTQNEKGSI